MVTYFLHRNTKQGWASKAKTIIDKKDIIHQAPPANYIFLIPPDILSTTRQN